MAVIASEKTANPDTAGHRQRLRNRFLAGGLDGFQDYEVIELLLTLGTPRKDCKAPAKEALRRFKTLQGVLEASSGELTRIHGIGDSNVFGLKFIKAVAERYVAVRMRNMEIVGSTGAVIDFLSLAIRDRSRECLLVIFLDAKNRVIDTDILFEGTLTASAVYPREVIRQAFEQRAAAMILAHNHPSGNPGPSPADKLVTRKLLFAAHAVDITLHDHLIVGKEGYYSFAESGAIRNWKAEFESGWAEKSRER